MQEQEAQGAAAGVQRQGCGRQEDGVTGLRVVGMVCGGVCLS